MSIQRTLKNVLLLFFRNPSSPLPSQDPSRENLRIREDGVGGVFVEGLSEQVVRNTGEILARLTEGSQLRTTAATKSNRASHICSL